MGRVGDSEPGPALLLDADVVIDYQHSDLTVVSLIAKHLGPLAVITAVVDEVDGMARKDFWSCPDIVDTFHLVQGGLDERKTG